MSYLALYRKYRPTNFDDLVGQSEVASIIKNEILNNKISHAYLFSGPRGTGKTSTAKIIAKMINCDHLEIDGTPCGKCDSCINFNSSSDIIEIDAASNNGVDEIRELRDKVNLVPTFGKYKIYIIDEVHMLTTQAFNALLKTLEEPPAHVVFILATTEFYKIPVTVVSRCQKFQFLKFSNDDIVSRLKTIASIEKIEVNDDVLYEIARLSDGGLRDAINMLDQLSSFKNTELMVEDVYKLNGVVSYVDFKDLLNYIATNDYIQMIHFLENIDKTGKNFERFVSDLIAFLKDIFVYKNTDTLFSNFKEKNDIIVFLSELFSRDDLYNMIIFLNDLSIRLKNSTLGKILMVAEFIKISNQLSKKEDNLKDISLKNKKNYQESNNEEVISLKKIPSKVNNKEILVKSFDFYGGITDKTKKIRINNAFSNANKQYKTNLVNNWSLVLEKSSSSSDYTSIAGMMNDIEVLVVGEKNIIFLAQYASLLERLFEQITVIESLLFEVLKKEYKIVFLLKDEWEYESKKYIANRSSYVYIEEEVDNKNDSLSSDENDEDIDNIISILGSDIITYK